MSWEITLIEWLQSFSNTALDLIIYIFTYLGDQLFFIGVAVIIYWCFSKAYAFRFINVYIWGAGVLESLKLIVKRPRPYKIDSIRAIHGETSGYSFPSGHSNSIANQCVQISRLCYKKKRHFPLALVLSCILIPLVMFTRLYLGQHFLTDVIAGAGIGILCAFVFDMLFSLIEKKSDKFWIIIVPLSVIILLIAVILGKSEAMETLLKGLGAYSAVTLGYFFERKFVNYEVRSGKLWKQILKVAIGLIVAVLLLEGGKLLLNMFISEGTWMFGVFTCFLRYFLTAFWAIFGAMFVFKKLKI